jgi:hypothetical protein
MTGRIQGFWFHNWMRYGVFVAIACATIVPVQAEAEFPFEVELLFDAKPLPGSKRIPMLEVFEDGRAMIDLWCHSGNGRIEIKGEMVTVTFGPMQPQGCTPDRLARDQELGGALAKVTQWRMEDDVVVLVGPTELRFRVSSH